jgi:hypothetical protein
MHRVHAEGVMGTKNRQRRAAKARERAKRRARPTPPRGDRFGGDDEWPDDLSARERRRAGWYEPGETAGDRGNAWSQLEIQLHYVLNAIWAAGWQPVELVRQVRRATKGIGIAGLVRQLIAVDHVRRTPDTLHPRWTAQIESLDLPTMSADAGWLAVAMGDRDPDRSRGAVSALHLILCQVGKLPRLIPPPGGSAGDVDIDVGNARGDDRDPVLERVRALLAQAESTTYPAEAEAFTAKAHELMIRHAIDAALVTGAAFGHGWATAIRLAIDEPYIDTKSLLLQIVAEHSRCRTVFHSPYAMSTVVGASADVAGVELMFTSLLLQAQQAMLAQAARAPAGSRERSASYRASFLYAYANRIGERLAEVNSEVAADVVERTGVDVLPVLASRADEIDSEVQRLFGDLTSHRVRTGWDAAGWSSGGRAADQANVFHSEVVAGGERDRERDRQSAQLPLGLAESA